MDKAWQASVGKAKELGISIKDGLEGRYDDTVHHARKAYYHNRIMDGFAKAGKDKVDLRDRMLAIGTDLAENCFNPTKLHATMQQKFRDGRRGALNCVRMRSL